MLMLKLYAVVLLVMLAGVSGKPRRPSIDTRRVNSPPIPYALDPLQWGTVKTYGWIHDWATAARNGAGSPENAAFARIKAHDYPPFHIPPDCQLSVDGWRDGRPCSLAFYDEDSAYWIDGMTRLGIVLGDEDLIKRVAQDFDAVMANPDWFNATWTKGKADGGHEAEGWVRSIYSRAMLAYYDFSGDQKILDFMSAAFSMYTPEDSRSDRSITQIEALTETHAFGGPEKLIDTAIGIMNINPSAKHYRDTLLSGCTNNESNIAKGGCLNDQHGVTFNELAKLFAMISSWNKNESYLQASINAFSMIENFDLQVHGVNSANEQLAGRSPNIGTETCDVSDFMYSNEWMLRLTGSQLYGDHLEKAFFNAAPGAVNRSFSGHLYFQSPNMVNTSSGFLMNSSITDPRWADLWYHTPPCCTGNQVRILPNFIHHMWFGTPDGGLAATAHGPSYVKTSIAGSSVTILTETNYPFNDTLSYTVTSSTSASWPLWLRIPSWCPNPVLQVNGEDIPVVQNKAGFAVLTRSWEGSSSVRLKLPMRIRATEGTTFANGNINIGPYDPVHEPWARITGQNGTNGLPYCVVEYGPLTFALALETTPGGPFNFAINCDISTMSVSHDFDMPPIWDWPLKAPISITVKAQEFPWENVWILPKSKIKSNPSKPMLSLKLVPYGCAKQFHLSMFPILN